MPFDLDPAYKQVPERIADFKAKFPDGRLRPADPLVPYRVETIGEKTFIVYVAAAYRTEDDKAPGIGTAWEPFPGRTPYTRDSELQNAETSAWGRAIVAALASESKSVASAEEVRNRRAEETRPPEDADERRALRLDIASLANRHGWDLDALGQEFTGLFGVPTSTATPANLRVFLATLTARAEEQAADPPGGTPDDAEPEAAPGEGPPEAADEKPALTADEFRDALLAAASKPEVRRLLREAALAGFADAEVDNGDGNGEPVSINTLATRRMREVPA